MASEREATVELVEYGGWKNNLRLSNDAVELIVTLDVGPRILSYRLLDGKNVFKEFSDQLGKAGEPEWAVRGGHRLWASPEDTTRTYYADNLPVAHAQLADGSVRFAPAPEAEYGLQKEIDVRLSPSGSEVTVLHRIKNVGKAATELAPWALTVMKPGGVEIIPLPPKSPHPGNPKNAKSSADFAPNQSLVLWPFVDLSDSRFGFGRRSLTLAQDTTKGPTKIGLAHAIGWVAYLNDQTLFTKRFVYEAGKTYPDRGCNYETFTNEEILEMESLGPLVTLQPGHSTDHTEHWHLAKVPGEWSGESDLDTLILPNLGRPHDGAA